MKHNRRTYRGSYKTRASAIIAVRLADQKEVQRIRLESRLRGNELKVFRLLRLSTDRVVKVTAAHGLSDRTAQQRLLAGTLGRVLKEHRLKMKTLATGNGRDFVVWLVKT